MKLSKTAWIVLTVSIFAIAFASLNTAYSRQGQEQSRLNEELSLVQLRLTKYSPEELSSQQRELESQLARAESQLEATKASLSQSIQSIEATDTLFEVAEAYGVEIIEISSLGLTSKTLEGITCSVLTLTAKAEGDVPNLINFTLELSKNFPTGVVESVEISVPEATEEEGETGEEETEEELGKPSANLRLCIYTYEGD